jgi:hypothetical protein
MNSELDIAVEASSAGSGFSTNAVLRRQPLKIGMLVTYHARQHVVVGITPMNRPGMTRLPAIALPWRSPSAAPGNSARASRRGLLPRALPLSATLRRLGRFAAPVHANDARVCLIRRIAFQMDAEKRLTVEGR